MFEPVKIDTIHHLPHNRPREEQIKYIIIHCSRGTAKEQIQTLDRLGLSVHYIIDRKGEITEVVPPSLVAYHAGISRWQNSPQKSLNGCSIGIEFESADLGQRKNFTPRSVNKLVRLLSHLMFVYKIRPENILGHSDIAPTRKPDPGAAFPWKRLAKELTSVWYDTDKLLKETNEQKLLETIGYDTADLPAARYAFCRHFFPKEVQIIEDITILVNSPYPKDFTPKDYPRYITYLRAAAYAYENARTKNYWYLNT